jgi:hypothetical protein
MAEVGRKRRARSGTVATDAAALPFEFTGFDVRTAAYPQKFYRVRQP